MKHDPEMIEMVARAIYREYEKRPDYAREQMNGYFAQDLAQAAINASRTVKREQIERMLNALCMPNVQIDYSKLAALLDLTLIEN